MNYNPESPWERSWEDAIIVDTIMRGSLEVIVVNMLNGLFAHDGQISLCFSGWIFYPLRLMSIFPLLWQSIGTLYDTRGLWILFWFGWIWTEIAIFWGLPNIMARSCKIWQNFRRVLRWPREIYFTFHESRMPCHESVVSSRKKCWLHEILPKLRQLTCYLPRGVVVVARYSCETWLLTLSTFARTWLILWRLLLLLEGHFARNDKSFPAFS